MMAQAQPAPVEGVYLCDHLDLPRLFAPALDVVPGLRVYAPADVPDPARIRFALAWRPGPDAFAPFPQLAFVQSIASGVDGILSSDSLPRQAQVARVRDPGQAHVMAGFAVWQLIWHHRNMGHYVRNAADAVWRRTSFGELVTPADLTVGVLGFGLMGRTIAEAVAKLGFHVIAASNTPRDGTDAVQVLSGPDACVAVARQADFLINILPLTTATRGLINADFIAQMKPGAVLIHLGRGEHVIEGDLLAALNSGHIGGASLDVFSSEPLPPEHPFWRHPKVLVTPHEASVLPAAAVVTSLRQSLQEAQAGLPLSAGVDRSKGY
jgi:glyoxylate/hydroxypyruvate reductase